MRKDEKRKKSKKLVLIAILSLVALTIFGFVLFASPRWRR